MLVPVRTVAPAVLPVSLDEAKLHCRIDFSDEDGLIDSYIETAAAHLDGYAGLLGRALITQTWQQDFPCFENIMRLAVGDLISVSSVAYYDTLNASQTLAASVYTTFADERGPYLTLGPDQDWPSTYTRADAVRVTWTAGYGGTAASVPAAIRHAMLLMIGDWHRNRENTIIGAASSELPIAVKSLLGPYRRVAFG